ncbi:RDD family protein [Actinopolymorpha pittospori]
MVTRRHTDGQEDIQVSELVTGEAVVLELRLARPATRALAFGIDALVDLAIFGLLMIPVALITGDDASESLISGLVIACLALTFVGYTTTIETLTRGKSVGKYALGLRVVRDDGGPVRFRQAFVRAMCGMFVDFFVTSGCVGFITAMLSPKGKRVGDMLAGTVVLRERAPKAQAALPQMPPELASWAARIELSTLPDQLALSVRSYLARYHELDPRARDVLGDQLATSVARFVAPPPPAGVPAWAYLTAVLAERRRRDLDRVGPSSGPTSGPTSGAPSRPTSGPTDPSQPTGTGSGGFAPPA